MRILSVLTYYRPHWTGLTATAAHVAEMLAAEGHPTTVVCVRHHRDLPAREMLDGVEVVRCAPVGRVSRGLVAPGLAAAVISRLRDTDVLHLHLPLAEAGALAAAARAAGVRVVATHHGDLVLPPGPFNRAVGALVHGSMLTAGHLAHAVTAYSDDYAGHSRLLLPLTHKVVETPPPIAIDPPAPDRVAAFRMRLGLSHAPIVGCAGRWVEEKGLDVLLAAFPLVRRRVPAAHLLFAGDTAVAYERFFEACAPLRQALNGQATYLDVIRDRSDLATFYGACDVFVLPSRSECLGRTQVEAMLCGTPVVASNVPGARTIVRATRFGRLVPPGDVKALADALCAVLETQDPPRGAGRHLATRFSPHAVLPAWVEALRGPAHALARPHPAACPDAPVPASVAHDLDPAYRRRTARMLAHLEDLPGGRVLDCGCGPGAHLRTIAEATGARVFGVDGDAARLGRARVIAPGRPVARSLVDRLPFRAETFDAVFLAEVLEHVSDEHALLAELRRVLTPGGILTISVPHARYPLAWDPFNRVWTACGGRPFRRGWLVGIWTHHVRLYTPQQLARCVQDAGFEIDSLEEATRACLPFHHFLVYGLGRPLVEGGWLPATLRARLDRSGVRNTPLAWWHPLRLAQRLVDRVDRFNVGRSPGGRAVNVLLKARRPRDEADAGARGARDAATAATAAVVATCHRPDR